MVPAWETWKRAFSDAGKSFERLFGVGRFARNDWAQACLRASPPTTHEARIRRYFRKKGTTGNDSGPRPERAQPLFICFTQRSGSNRLAELLTSTGKLPLAKGYFSWQAVIKQSERNKLGSFEQYCAHLMQTRKANGLFTCKTSAAQLSFLTKEKLIPELFAAPRFIHLRRRDLLAQAISFVIARQTEEWSTGKKAKADPTYDPVAIAARARAIAAANAWFEEYFAVFGFPVFEVVYEDLAADENGVVSAVTEWLGLGASEINPEKTKLQPQRSTLNDEWRSRFLSEGRQYFGASAAIGVAAAPVSRR